MTNSYLLPGLSRLDTFALTRKLASVYRDCAKNHSSRLATYFTAGPLYVITFYLHLPACPKFSLRHYLDKLIIPWLIRIVWQIRFHMTAANWPSLRQACFIPVTDLFHLDNCLTCTLTGLPRRKLAYGNSRFCFGRRYKTGSWTPFASSQSTLASLTLVSHDTFVSCDKFVISWLPQTSRPFGKLVL